MDAQVNLLAAFKWSAGALGIGLLEVFECFSNFLSVLSNFLVWDGTEMKELPGRASPKRMKFEVGGRDQRKDSLGKKRDMKGKLFSAGFLLRWEGATHVAASPR